MKFFSQFHFNFNKIHLFYTFTTSIIIIIREQCILELEQFILGITGICGSAQLNLTQTQFFSVTIPPWAYNRTHFAMQIQSPLIEISSHTWYHRVRTIGASFHRSKEITWNNSEYSFNCTPTNWYSFLFETWYNAGQEPESEPQSRAQCSKIECNICTRITFSHSAVIQSSWWLKLC